MQHVIVKVCQSVLVVEAPLRSYRILNQSEQRYLWPRTERRKASQQTRDVTAS